MFTSSEDLISCCQSAMAMNVNDEDTQQGAKPDVFRAEGHESQVAAGSSLHKRLRSSSACSRYDEDCCETASSSGGEGGSSPEIIGEPYNNK